MTAYANMETTALEAELKKLQTILADIRDERAFLGKQVGMHINASEFARLDRDAEATETKIAAIERELASRS